MYPYAAALFQNGLKNKQKKKNFFSLKYTLSCQSENKWVFLCVCVWGDFTTSLKNKKTKKSSIQN